MAKHRYALVACARWEEEAIEEWLEYHRSIGFDHVYLYSNDDDPTALLTAVSRYVRGRAPFVTFRHWPRVGDQVPIYLDFLDEFKAETDWYSLLDIDEFFVLRNENNIHAFMQAYENEVDCLYFNWVLYGHDGNVQRPSGSTLLTHRRRARGPDVQHEDAVPISGDMRRGCQAEGQSRLRCVLAFPRQLSVGWRPLPRCTVSPHRRIFGEISANRRAFYGPAEFRGRRAKSRLRRALPVQIGGGFPAPMAAWRLRGHR